MTMLVSWAVMTPLCLGTPLVVKLLGYMILDYSVKTKIRQNDLRGYYEVKF